MGIIWDLEFGTWNFPKGGRMTYSIGGISQKGRWTGEENFGYLVIEIWELFVIWYLVLGISRRGEDDVFYREN